MSQQNNRTEGKVTLVDVKDYFIDLVKDIFDLDKGVDKWGTIREVKSKQSMSGANAWMLICSIMIASIGLNLDSQAVIIGAMLISPLMSPILGIGMGVAINDKDALSHALLHFGSAILIALISSTLYFWLMPLDEFTPQIQARTEPTFLDILIAVFGGIAGIVSIARKDISTTLPGVAIATALMPPLCVTGFGIANGLWFVAYKAFYLFFLNSFFVAFATYVIIRRMNFPFKKYANPKDRRKNIFIVGVFSLMMVVPSVMIFSTVLNKYKQDRMLKQFVETNFIDREFDHLDGYKLMPVDNPNKLLLKVYGDVINDSKMDQYKKSLKDVGLDYITDIEIISTSEIDLEKINQLDTELSGIHEKLNTQIEQLQDERESKQKYIDYLQDKEDFFMQDSAKFVTVSEQLKIIFPDINELGLAVTQNTNYSQQHKELPTVIVDWPKARRADVEKLKAFVVKSYNLDTLKVVIQN